MNYKFVVAAIAIPMSLTSLLTKSVSAAEIAPKLEANHSSMLVAQRYDDRRNDDNRREELRREQIRREEAQRYDDRRNDDNRREELRREQIREEAQREQERRREYTRRVWIPGHYESGFLGIGRNWVAGHWEEHR